MHMVEGSETLGMEMCVLGMSQQECYLKMPGPWMWSTAIVHRVRVCDVLCSVPSTKPSMEMCGLPSEIAQTRAWDNRHISDWERGKQPRKLSENTCSLFFWTEGGGNRRLRGQGLCGVPQFPLEDCILTPKDGMQRRHRSQNVLVP